MGADCAAAMSAVSSSSVTSRSPNLRTDRWASCSRMVSLTAARFAAGSPYRSVALMASPPCRGGYRLPLYRFAQPPDECVADPCGLAFVRGVGQDEVADAQLGVPVQRGGDLVG